MISYQTILDIQKNICVNLANNQTYITDFAEDEISPSVKGILSIENGGTGKNDLNEITVGTAKKINTIIENNEYIPLQIGLQDEFARIKIGIENSTGYLELATADNGNEPIYIRQYYGEFDTLYRTVTLLDTEGNSNFPGVITSNQLNTNIINSTDINSNKIDSTNFIGINSTIQNSNITNLISNQIDINLANIKNSNIETLISSDTNIVNATINTINTNLINNNQLISNLIKVEKIKDCNSITVNDFKSNNIETDHIDVTDIISTQVLTQNIIADKIKTNILILPTISSTEEGAIWIE